MQEVDKQSWDPSVKALTAFPSVLDNMAKNLAWTSELGEVYNHQPKDVMEAVQTLRVKAKEAGNLKTTSQITVVQQISEHHRHPTSKSAGHLCAGVQPRRSLRHAIRGARIHRRGQ